MNPRPTIGRIVLVHHPRLHQPGRLAPALIVAVHTDVAISAQAFGENGAVLFLERLELDEELEHSEGWSWPTIMPRVAP